MSLDYKCNVCSKTYDTYTLIWHCECGGLLNLEALPISFPIDKIRKRSGTMWRYLEALPFFEEEIWKSVTLGEGFTPIVPLDGVGTNVLVKLDYLMPTFSFKDRGAVMLIAKAKELGVKMLIADSSGNAGASISAYASRAGIKCHIYVPENTSPKKINQIESSGATVHKIPGNREDTANAAKKAVEKEGAFYASHVYNPYFFQGTKTYAYEIWEQSLGNMPEVIVLSVGQGTLLLGVYNGFKDLFNLGLINKMPRIIAVQAERCAPLALAFKNDWTEAKPINNLGTVAEGMSIAAPLRSREILAAVRHTNGVIVTAPELAISSSQSYLSNKGFYVESTTAAVFAGFYDYVQDCLGNRLEKNIPSIFTEDPFGKKNKGKVVICLTGSGLKEG